MQVSLEDAYAEACRALGEAVVRERLLTAEVHRLTALTAAGPPEPPAHAGTIADPDPAPPYSPARVQHA